MIVDPENPYYDSRNNCNAIIETSSNKLLYGCRNSIIPDDITSIEGFAFVCCTSLTSITIPSSVTSIGDRAFRYCSNLTEMTVLATTPPTLSKTDSISSATTKIYIPAWTLSAYQNATYWSSFADKFVELA